MPEEGVVGPLRMRVRAESLLTRFLTDRVMEDSAVPPPPPRAGRGTVGAGMRVGAAAGAGAAAAAAAAAGAAAAGMRGGATSRRPVGKPMLEWMKGVVVPDLDSMDDDRTRPAGNPIGS